MNQNSNLILISEEHIAQIIANQLKPLYEYIEGQKTGCSANAKPPPSSA
jgi:hypothetical protein